MSYTMGSAGGSIAEIAALAEARAKYEEEYAKTHEALRTGLTI